MGSESPNAGLACGPRFGERCCLETFLACSRSRGPSPAGAPRRAERSLCLKLDRCCQSVLARLMSRDEGHEAALCGLFRDTHSRPFDLQLLRFHVPLLLPWLSLLHSADAKPCVCVCENHQWVCVKLVLTESATEREAAQEPRGEHLQVTSRCFPDSLFPLLIISNLQGSVLAPPSHQELRLDSWQIISNLISIE